MRFAFFAKHRGAWQTRQMCETPGVSRAGFYEWLKRPQSRRSQQNDKLLAAVRTSYQQSDRTYGSPRICRDMLAWGHACGRHRVARLMLRRFNATAPNQRWVADFTHIWTSDGWLYVAIVLDLFSRRIVRWSMSTHMTAQLVTDALLMALWRGGKPRELLHHSDHCSQYTSEMFQRLLSENGIVCSMSRSGDVWDNSATESVFSGFKIERVHRNVYGTRDAAKADVFDYIERFYNL